MGKKKPAEENKPKDQLGVINPKKFSPSGKKANTPKGGLDEDPQQLLNRLPQDLLGAVLFKRVQLALNNVELDARNTATNR